MTEEIRHDCATCGAKFIIQHPALCEVFGIPNPRLVFTGFQLYDSVADVDVDELDSCDRTDCPGLKGDAA